MDRQSVLDLLERELIAMRDPEMIHLVCQLRVEPYSVARDWDYGEPGERHHCWTILEHRPSNTGVAYCESGFGPGHPWGLVFLSGLQMSMGMDSSWFSTLEGAVRESMAWDDDNPRGYEIQ